MLLWDYTTSNFGLHNWLIHIVLLCTTHRVTLHYTRSNFRLHILVNLELYTHRVTLDYTSSYFDNTYRVYQLTHRVTLDYTTAGYIVLHFVLLHGFTKCYFGTTESLLWTIQPVTLRLLTGYINLYTELLWSTQLHVISYSV